MKGESEALRVDNDQLRYELLCSSCRAYLDRKQPGNTIEGMACPHWMDLFIPVLAGQYILHHVSYENPSQPGFFGKVSAFAKAQSISREKAQRQLQQKLIYTLHKPRRRRIPTLPPGCLV